MRRWSFVSILVLVVSLAAALAAQSTTKSNTTAPAKSSSTLRTVDGQPDLQGVWDFRTVTPMERPSELGNKEVFSDQEAEEFAVKRVQESNVDNLRGKTASGASNGQTTTQDVSLAYNEFWFDRGNKVVGTKRTSLVVDPPDGKIPALTPEAKKRLDAERIARERPAEGPEDRSVGERCIMGFNSGPPMVPAAYNQNMQIFQTAGHVVVLNEMVHNARIIPLDNRPYGNIRQWVGMSRGHWEGNTLVVDTRNFSGVTAFRGSSANLHLIERFTRVDKDTLLYEFTAEDPTTWTRKWTAQIPMVRNPQPIYEYACHEGNYGMEGILSAARAAEREAANARTKSGR
jgi:hypothetical protein